MSFGTQYNVTWKDIVDEKLPDEILAPIDDSGFLPHSTIQKTWVEQGAVYLPKLLLDEEMAPYIRVREELGLPGGWPDPTPYMRVPELLELSTNPKIMKAMKHLIGEDMGLHLNLTGWVSTQRNWHQDSYLNPEFVGTRYVAAWIALDDIHENSGPFQFVAGSHRWEVIRQHKVFQHLTPSEQADPAWPTKTQDWISKVCFDEVYGREAPVTTYTPKKGDVLLWHSNLIHRGSEPRDLSLQRRSLIAHYSALSARPDMPRRAQHTNGEHYFVF